MRAKIAQAYARQVKMRKPRMPALRVPDFIFVEYESASVQK
jgi:hypothetical protein